MSPSAAGQFIGVDYNNSELDDKSLAPEAGSFIDIYKQKKPVIHPRSARQVGQGYEEKSFAGYRPKESESDVKDGVSDQNEIDFGDDISEIELPSRYLHHHSMSKMTIDASKSRVTLKKYL